MGGSDNRWVGKKPLAFRLLLYFVSRPFLGFTLTLLLAMSVALAPSGSSVTALYLVLFPWLLLIAFLLNMPLVGAAIRGFRLSEDVRINHALEHGTIYFLRRRYGKQYKIGGKAQADGFRLNGLPSDDCVLPAFADLQAELAKGNARAVVSKQCGSMIVTAQGLAVMLFTLAMISFMVVDMTPRSKRAVLGSIVLLYLLTRHGLGWLCQKRLFLSVKFTGAQIQSIHRVKPGGLIERQRAYLVRTIVQKPAPVENGLTTV